MPHIIQNFFIPKIFPSISNSFGKRITQPLFGKVVPIWSTHQISLQQPRASRFLIHFGRNNSLSRTSLPTPHISTRGLATPGNARAPIIIDLQTASCAVGSHESDDTLWDKSCEAASLSESVPHQDHPHSSFNPPNALPCNTIVDNDGRLTQNC